MSETRVGEPGEEPADFKAMEIAADEAPSASDLEDDSEGFEEIVITGQEVVEELQRLIPAALESAEAANKASKLGLDALTKIASSGESVQRASKRLAETFEKQASIVKFIYVGGFSLLFLGILIFVVMTVQISSRLSELDAVIVAASKRIVNLNSGLETFENIRFAIHQVGEQQQEQTTQIRLLAEQLQNTEQLVVKMGLEWPQSAASHLDGSLVGLQNETKSTSQSLSEQQAAMTALSADVAKVERRMASVQETLNRSAQLGQDVEALLTLERARYLETINARIKQQQDMEAGVEPPDAPGTIRYQAPR
jgi:methyl-accepting chemotaxis protein